jgi:hypothetical protein
VRPFACNLNGVSQLCLGRAVLIDFFEANPPSGLPGFLVGVFVKVGVPLAIAVASFGGSVKLYRNIWCYMVPPEAAVGHKDAQALYLQPGYTLEAVHAWSRNDTYGPEPRACHEIYVHWQPQEGLKFLKEAQAQRVEFKTSIQQVEEMKLDASAILQGNKLMVDMNARLAKEELLGMAKSLIRKYGVVSEV